MRRRRAIVFRRLLVSPVPVFFVPSGVGARVRRMPGPFGFVARGRIFFVDVGVLPRLLVGLLAEFMAPSFILWPSSFSDGPASSTALLCPPAVVGPRTEAARPVLVAWRRPLAAVRGPLLAMSEVLAAALAAPGVVAPAPFYSVVILAVAT